MSNYSLIPSPPPELVQQWENRIFDEQENVDVLLIEAYKAGADQELEACCEWFICDWTDIETADNLRAARRPKPPSLKEQALADLASMSIEPCLINDIDVNASVRAKYDTIRRALEALPE